MRGRSPGVFRARGVRRAVEDTPVRQTLVVTGSSRFDEIAPVYDETRGGESRGDEYAADIDRLLPEGPGTVLEIGVGTAVVSLGLRRRGRTVVGVDLSGPMLARAAARLGPSVVQGDALELPVRAGGVDHAVAVWVIHDVTDPDRLLQEAARILRSGGKLVVSDMQVPHRDNRSDGSSTNSPSACTPTMAVSTRVACEAMRSSSGLLSTA